MSTYLPIYESVNFNMVDAVCLQLIWHFNPVKDCNVVATTKITIFQYLPWFVQLINKLVHLLYFDAYMPTRTYVLRSCS